MANTDVLAPGFKTMTEFGKYNGCCGQCATLAGLTTRDPARWHQDLPTLNAIVDEQLRDGYADAALHGGQNIYSAANWLRNHEHVPCTVVGWDQSQNSGGAVFSLQALHDTLTQQIITNPDGSHSWRRPVVVEIATTGKGMIEDEHGVNVHFVCVGGVALPNGGWYRADGDAVTYNDPHGGLKYPILTSWTEFLNSSPIAWLVIDLDVGPAPGGGGQPPMGVPQNWHDDQATSTLTAPNQKTVTLGFRDHVIKASPQWASDNWPLEEAVHLQFVEYHNHQLGAGERQIFLRNMLRYNNPTEGVMESDLGAELLAAEADINSLQALLTTADNNEKQLTDAVAKLTAELAAAGGKTPDAYTRLIALLDSLGISHT